MRVYFILSIALTIAPLIQAMEMENDSSSKSSRRLSSSSELSSSSSSESEILPIEDSSSSSSSEIQVTDNSTTEADVEKQSPPFFSKCTKVKLIKAGLLSTWLAIYATTMWAAATYLENECEDYHYCVNKETTQVVEVNSSITNCTDPYWQGSPAVVTRCSYMRTAVLTLFGIFGLSPFAYCCLRPFLD